MDKKLSIILLCGVIIFIVYLLLNNTNNILQIKNDDKNNIENELMNIEPFNQENNLALNKNPEFDPYTFYTKSGLNKDNFDFKYTEHFQDENIQAQGVQNLSKLRKTATYLESEPTNKLEESPNWISYNENKNNNFLVPNDLDSNSIFTIPFPENTSIELANFTAENVTDLYDADKMDDLYNSINADPYRGYRTLKFML